MPTLQQVVKEGVDQSLAKYLGDAAHAATKALETASRPLLGKVMQVTQAAELEKRKARIKLTECDGRLCAYAASDQGGNYKSNWPAPWYAKEDSSPLVILKGY